MRKTLCADPLFGVRFFASKHDRSGEAAQNKRLAVFADGKAIDCAQLFPGPRAALAAAESGGGSLIRAFNQHRQIVLDSLQ